MSLAYALLVEDGAVHADGRTPQSEPLWLLMWSDGTVTWEPAVRQRGPASGAYPAEHTAPLPSAVEKENAARTADKAERGQVIPIPIDRPPLSPRGGR